MTYVLEIPRKWWALPQDFHFSVEIHFSDVTFWLLMFGHEKEKKKDMGHESKYQNENRKTFVHLSGFGICNMLVPGDI